MVDGRVARGDRTRAAVLDRAVALATEEGLDGLSLGQLAVNLGVSKSGLFAHWRSKEELQLATIERAREQWITQVISPALRAPRGIRRLWALHDARMRFYEGEFLPGGCFFANVEFEFHARPGVIHDRVAEAFTEWMELIERVASEAVAGGELDADTDIRLLAYEFEAFGMAAVMQARMIAEPRDAYRFARRSVLDRLRHLATDPTLLTEA